MDLFGLGAADAVLVTGFSFFSLVSAFDEPFSDFGCGSQTGSRSIAELLVAVAVVTEISSCPSRGVVA